ncbi:efflux RND transporter permease subunit [Poseidonibacter lekithochrous]|uniref:efflux RND transporter permease subunit n=1 Tax=Poseidonibacter lekithochrous TaxID=1904463 RepID=UPI0008FC8D87|nr:efflux RND transporter permease subunit [Poseidonibacter lekithochrous]QKJ22109.1 RND family efflux system, inner membrane transporter, AcrB family [Poseidonibacter lekithochrous]
MFDKILRFFVNNSRVNYTLFILVFAIGIWSYNKTPKEIFPSFELDMISITGSYSGASVDILDRMAVIEIEDNVKNIDSVDTMSTIISPGRFTIVLELKNGKNKYNEADKIKDAISLIKSNLPSDMDEPSVNVLERSRSVVDISLTSSKYSTDELKPFADNLKSKILGVNGVNDVTIFGDSDKYFEILLDDRKIEALDLNKNEIFDAITTLSYIFPVGKIEDPKKHYYISTYNGAKNANEFANTLLRIGNKSVYLSDIASTSKKYEDSSTLYSFNGKNALSLAVEQSDTADAIVIVKSIKKLLPSLNKLNPDINISVADDNSERIVDRLNIVISNIILGIILITILVMILINFRMSFIIAVGIPTSFVIAAIYMYLSGYTINMISLVGVLIAIGIVVDDAIVVSENIQQYIEEGLPPKEAAIKGASEMVKPVTVASITTLFSFLPVLMISGTMGEVMKLIPIALSALVVASLIESFIFLPIHAAHSLKNGAKVTSWEKANQIYNKIIHFFMNWKKTFLTIFIIMVPVLIVMEVTSSKFQLFPKFDASDVKLSFKMDANTTLEESFKIVQEIEKDFMDNRDKFFIRSIDSVAGYRRDVGGNTERFPYVMYMTIELQKLKAANILDKYVTPNLSFYYDDEDRTRTEKSRQIAKKLKKFIEKKNYKDKYNLEEAEVLERKVGPVKADVKIGLISHDNQKIIKAIEKLQVEIEAIEGIKSVSNSLKFGIDEIKIKVNSYGEQLGITESFIGSYLSNLYLLKKKTVTFDEKEMLDVKVQSINKDDFQSFKNTQIPLSDGTFVSLEQIVDLNSIRGFEQLLKDQGEKNFYIFANVDPDIVTSSEVLVKLQASLETIKESGIRLVFKGEAEKNKSLMNDMILATALALILIMMSMLYLFNSFRETFIVMSIIPFSTLGVLIGHQIMGLNLSMPSMIGALGLAGVVINDGIIMMTYLKKAKTMDEIFQRATKRFRPIIITTITTLIGMSSLIFFPTGQAVIFQPIAIALGFGLAWGTILNLIYLPVLYTITHKLRKSKV